MKNPKVGKAEILEGVIHFLKAEKGHQRAVASPDGEHSYRDGMASCLLRVRGFISAQNQELLEGSAGAAAGAGAGGPQSPGLRHLAPGRSPAAEPPSPARLHLQHQQQTFLTQLGGLSCDSQELFSATAAPPHVSSAVWRPWPK